MITDYHTHSYRCGHATGTMTEYIDQAIARGLGEIGLTDHLYLYYEQPENRDRQWAMPEEEYDSHYQEMLELREAYRTRINVRVSVEADYVAGHEEELQQILSRYHYDYILGAVHFMDGWLIDDVANSPRYRQEGVAEIYRRYFRNLRKAIELNVFDVVAHFDLPKKFGFMPEEDVSKEVNETLDLIYEHGVALEVSTAGLRKPVREIYPAPTIIRQMKRRNIPIVLSSDAHDPSEIASDYQSTLATLHSIGYETLLTFDRREARFVPMG